MKSKLYIGLIILFLIAQQPVLAAFKEPYDPKVGYQLTLRSKIARVILFPYRYAKLTLMYDFGLKQSVYLALEYPDICWGGD